MEEKNLVNYLENFSNKKVIFKNKSILQSNFIPENILHRDDQIKQLAQILAPLLRNEKPSNVFIYGKTGTGKTLTTKYVLNQIEKISQQKNNKLKIIYLNCKMKKVADTEYRLIAQLAREFGKAIPPTGLPTDEVYSAFFSALEKESQQIVFILDEIDQLVQKIGNEILYNLTRMNIELKNSQVSIIGISNNTFFSEILDPRVKSSLSQEEIIFPPYNALQIQTILKQRADESFFENILEEGLLEKCAAYAARDHGDARRALELLRVAGELAERENSEQIKITHLDLAENKIENDRISELISSQPKQYHAVLYSILKLSEHKKEKIFTGEVYELYQQVCEKTQLRPLTQRRVSDILAEFDMLGLINASIISKGRYGRTREIFVQKEAFTDNVKKFLSDQLSL